MNKIVTHALDDGSVKWLNLLGVECDFCGVTKIASNALFSFPIEIKQIFNFPNWVIEAKSMLSSRLTLPLPAQELAAGRWDLRVMTSLLSGHWSGDLICSGHLCSQQKRRLCSLPMIHTAACRVGTRPSLPRSALQFLRPEGETSTLSEGLPLLITFIEGSRFHDCYQPRVAFPILLHQMPLRFQKRMGKAQRNPTEKILLFPQRVFCVETNA